MKAASKNQSVNKVDAESKAMEAFGELMIKRIEEMQLGQKWEKPWLTAMVQPKNIHGRNYTETNALMLMLLCMDKNYEVPYFCTFNMLQEYNEACKGNKDIPFVHINKGEKSFPVFFYSFIFYNPETKKRITEEQYNALSKSEKDEYRKIPIGRCYPVFNVQQTNLKEARPEIYAKFVEASKSENVKKCNEVAFAEMDEMISENSWICPIKAMKSDRAFYSVANDEITVPEKSQFADDEKFYSTLLHEMAHSTGSEKCLKRLKPAEFGSKEYAREELVAELTAALVSSKYGMEKTVKEDSVPYIHAWLESLKEDAKFIKTVLNDVKKASSFICKSLEGEKKNDVSKAA